MSISVAHILPAPNCAFTVGQAESMVKELKQRLKFSLSSTKKEWKKALKITTLSINLAYKEALGTSAFFVVHGFSPRTPLDNRIGFYHDSKNIDEFCATRDANKNSAAVTLRKHRSKYVQNSNRNRGPVVYDVDQYVYIFERHLQPNTSKLLSKQWRGPYQVKRKVSDTLYVVSKFNPLTKKPKFLPMLYT